jgi:hypothetical protein
MAGFHPAIISLAVLEQNLGEEKQIVGDTVPESSNLGYHPSACQPTAVKKQALSSLDTEEAFHESS